MDRFMQQTLRQALQDLLFFKISNFLPGPGCFIVSIPNPDNTNEK